MTTALSTQPTAAAASILVVDDDQDIREAVEDLLSQRGYQVATAVNGADALEKLSKCRFVPSLIVLDLDMPVMNGRELLKRIATHARLREVPVLVLSASAEREGLRSEIKMLRKPVSGDTLLAEVELCLARTRKPITLECEQVP